MKYNLIFSSSHVSPLFLKQSMNSTAPETWESTISEKINQICCCTLRNYFVPDYWHLKRCGRRRRSISIKRYASLATMPWSLSMLSFHFFQPSNCTLCSRGWCFFFNFSSPLYLYIFLHQGCTWLEKIAAGMCGAVIVPRAPISSAFISSFLCICSNAIHATGFALSKIFTKYLQNTTSAEMQYMPPPLQCQNIFMSF